MNKNLVRLLPLVITTAVLAAACGGKASFSPTSPSPVVGPPAASGGATIAGSVRMAATAPSADSASSTITVRVVGTDLATTVSPSGHFTLTGVPSGEVRLHFTGPGIDAQVSLGQVEPGQTVTISVTVSGSTAVVESQQRGGHDASKVELEGRVESLPPTQPPGTLVVAGRAVRTDASTVIRHGSKTMTLADLEIGMRVHVKGHSDATGVLATIIEVQNTNTDVPVQVNGTIDTLTGNELAFQFKIGSRVIRGDHQTQFFGSGKMSSFADLRNGVRVEVKGQQRDGYIYAVRIHVHKAEDDDDDGEVEVEGTVGALSGTCPSLAFRVAGKKITTNGATQFKHVACSALKNGSKVEIEGARQADGSILARKVEAEEADDDDGDDGAKVEVEGTISGLTGTCPALTFTVKNQKIVTNGGTKFEGAACSALKNGTKVEVEGTRQADTSVLAKKVKKES